MRSVCSYCGNDILDMCLTYKGHSYHALRGMNEGRLIYVERGKTCFEQSEMGTRSLVGKFPPVIMEKKP